MQQVKNLMQHLDYVEQAQDLFKNDEARDTLINELYKTLHNYLNALDGDDIFKLSLHYPQHIDILYRYIKNTTICEFPKMHPALEWYKYWGTHKEYMLDQITGLWSLMDWYYYFPQDKELILDKILTPHQAYLCLRYVGYDESLIKLLNKKYINKYVEYKRSQLSLYKKIISYLDSSYTERVLNNKEI